MIGNRQRSRHERLPPESTSAGRARRLVADVLAEAGLAELADVALLLVSETVTNAVLHAATEVELTVVAEDGRLRVEVRDGSSVLPGIRHYDDVATTGRGVGLVEVLAASWGVEPRVDGKTVWFTLGREDESPSDGPGPAPAAAAGAEPPALTVRFRSLPVHLVRATLQYADAVLREIALATLSGQPVAGLPVWRGTTIDLSPVLEPVERALADGRDALDLDATFPVDAVAGAGERLALLDAAGRLIGTGAFHAPRALPEIRLARHWLLGEIVAQAGGAEPTPWMDAPDLAHNETWVPLSDGERAELDRHRGPLVVADESNHIVHADDAAAELLGWTAEDLIGRRLTTVIPPALRDAHIAGYARYQLTREPVIIGRSIEVHALRRDGITVQVDLHIEAYTSVDGRPGYRATLDPV